MVWWRVVLDEAQNIKDQKAQRSLAAFDLKVSRSGFLFVSLLPVDQLISHASRLHFLSLPVIRGFNTQ